MTTAREQTFDAVASAWSDNYERKVSNRAHERMADAASDVWEPLLRQALVMVRDPWDWDDWHYEAKCRFCGVKRLMRELIREVPRPKGGTMGEAFPPAKTHLPDCRWLKLKEALGDG